MVVYQLILGLMGVMSQKEKVILQLREVRTQALKAMTLMSTVVHRRNKWQKDELILNL